MLKTKTNLATAREFEHTTGWTPVTLITELTGTLPNALPITDYYKRLFNRTDYQCRDRNAPITDLSLNSQKHGKTG